MREFNQQSVIAVMESLNEIYCINYNGFEFLKSIVGFFPDQSFVLRFFR